MEECKPVLVDQTRLAYGFDTTFWTLNENATPAMSYTENMEEATTADAS